MIMTLSEMKVYGYNKNYHLGGIMQKGPWWTESLSYWYQKRDGHGHACPSFGMAPTF